MDSFIAFPKNYSKPKKNTKRSVENKVKIAVNLRDCRCIICQGAIEHYHHAYYGAESNYSSGRNNADQIVGLCTSCHHKLHNEGGNNYRQFCKDYLRNL